MYTYIISPLKVVDGDTIDGQEKLTLVSLNELLINEGHATEYHGGKR